jgi:hypothetical protein
VNLANHWLALALLALVVPRAELAHPLAVLPSSALFHAAWGEDTLNVKAIDYLFVDLDKLLTLEKQGKSISTLLGNPYLHTTSEENTSFFEGWKVAHTRGMVSDLVMSLLRLNHVESRRLRSKYFSPRQR